MNRTTTQPVRSSQRALHIDTMVVVLDTRGLGRPADPIEGAARTSFGDHEHSDMIFLDPRGDGLTPVLCPCHRTVLCLITPAQREAAVAAATAHDLTIGHQSWPLS